MGPDSELEFYLPLGCLSLLDSFPSMWVSILTLQSLDRNSSYLAGFFFSMVLWQSSISCLKKTSYNFSLA